MTTKEWRGVFNLSDAEIQQNAGNIAILSQNFVVLGNARIGDVVELPGHFVASTEVDLAAVAGRQLVIWIFRSTDNSSIASSIATAVHTGVFYMPQALNFLLEEDLSGNVKKLAGSIDAYRLRIGNYRVLFDLEGRIVTVQSVGHRKDIYR